MDAARLAGLVSLFAAAALAACGGGGGDSPAPSPSPAPAPAPAVVTTEFSASVYMGTPTLSIDPGTLRLSSSTSTPANQTVTATAGAYSVTLTTTNTFTTASISSGVGVVRAAGHLFLHCPLGAGGSRAALEAGRVVVSANMTAVTDLAELRNKTYDESNCGGRVDSAFTINADGSATIDSETLSAGVMAQLFSAAGFNFVSPTENNTHRAVPYKITLNGTTRYFFVMRNDENRPDGRERAVALYSSR